MRFREVALLFTFTFTAYAVSKLCKAFNSRDGERYFKRRMQGHFVSVPAEEAASDAANKSWFRKLNGCFGARIRPFGLAERIAQRD